MPDASVLIVEDEAIVAAHLSNTVQKLGYDVLEVVSPGTTAVTRVAQLKPDLVLMDITLDGDKDGVMAAQTIGQRFKIPVVFVTAHTDRNTIDRARATSPSGYVVKPFDEDTLGAAISKALEGSDPKPAAAASRASILTIDAWPTPRRPSSICWRASTPSNSRRPLPMPDRCWPQHPST